MASIRSLGVGSGIDAESIVTKLMSLEQRPLTLIKAKEATANAKISAFGSIKSLLDTLKTAADTLGTANKLAAYTASSSITDTLTATASSTATAGTYDITVTQLATINKKSNSTAIAGDSTTVIGAGTFTLKLEGASSDTVITTTAGSTLADLRDSINASSAGIKAGIVTGQNATTGATESRLILTGSETGKKITTASSSIASFGSFNDLTGYTGQTAQLTIEGQNVTSTSNTISSAIAGVTINLAKAGSSTLTIARNKDAVKTAVDSFIKGYNDLNSKIRSLSLYDSANKKANTLTGDATSRTIQNQISAILTGTPGTPSGTYSRLADIGITTGTDGSLSVNATKLQNSIDTDFSSLSSVLNRYGSAMYTKAGEFTATGGLITGKTDSLTSMNKAYAKQKESLDLRLTAIEKRYRSQFTALDTLVSSMQTTSTYLTQQLAKL